MLRTGGTELKVYLDNVVASGKVRGDLEPVTEKNAVQTLTKANSEGSIEVGLVEQPPLVRL